MNESSFNKYKFIQYWVNGSDEDYITMMALYDTRRYSWSLFVGHLMIEKLLKAYFIQEYGSSPPFGHNLIRLAEKAKLELNNQNKFDLTTITAFNINARYDDYKMSFQKKCTPEFTSEWIEKLKNVRLWIKGLINK